jgi:uncharacterized membrane protein YsdA (DUF1294 family)
MSTRQRAMSPAVRTLNYWLSGILLSLTAALIMEGALALSLILGWLIAVNVFALLFYAIDKLNSVWVGDSEKREKEKVRIPESALLLLALAGGSPAALVAMVLLSHKISKGWFMFRFLLILAVQGVVFYLFGDRIPWPWSEPLM